MMNTNTADVGLIARLRGTIASLADAYARRRVYNETLRELSALTARDMADLGIHRSMITRIAHEAAYGK
ncbi:DUF1127 domain-containing protein [Paracoccus sp. p3-h83]